MQLANDEIRLASPVAGDSIVDGPGLRAVVWCQGCYRACPGCHNPETWDVQAGTVVKIDWVKQKLRQMEGQTGLTLSGGEPMLQAKACKGRDWSTREMWELVKSIDMLIDGPFILAERDLSLKFRGSRNQRLLHLKDGEIVKVE